MNIDTIENVGKARQTVSMVSSGRENGEDPA